MRALAAACLAVALTGCGQGEPVVRFARLGTSSGFRFRHELPGGRMDNLPKAAMGGLAIFDADGDGDQDLYFVNGGWHPQLAGVPRPENPAPNRFLRNRGGMRFEDVTEQSGLGDTGFGMGVTVGDIDNDGLVDLFVMNYGGSVLFRNVGDGKFEDVTEHAGIEGDFHAGATFFDMDRDGDLDLFVGQYVDVTDMAGMMASHGPDTPFPPPAAYTGQKSRMYRNRGDGTFEDVTALSQIAAPGKTMGVLATDIDDDGWIDVIVGNDSEANFVWRNNGDGTFTDFAPTIGMAYGPDGGARAAMGVSAGDVSGDGRLDYLVPDTRDGCVYVAEKTWTTERTQKLGLGGLVGRLIGWADAPLDVDLDGDVDVYKTHGDIYTVRPQDSFLCLNDGNARFTRLGIEAQADVAGAGRGVAVGDLDDDGRPDLVVLVLEGQAALLHNRTENAGHWVRLRLVGTQSNRLALGARVTARAGERKLVAEVSGSTGYLSVNDLRPLFGLGSETVLRDVVVRWPTGETESFGDLECDREHALVEASGTR